jgi:hypothetical protein
MNAFVVAVWAQALQTIAPEAYVDLEGIWKHPYILVCWEPGAESYGAEKDWVKDTVTEHIQNVSSIIFHRWDGCGAQDIGIRIRVADERPNSDVGIQWARDASGAKRRGGFNQEIQVPTRMVLNFTFGFHPAYRDNCTPQREREREREHCIRAIGLHEFLHAVGFLHEQLRSDAPAACKEQWGHQPDFRGVSPHFGTLQYDADSHMNYCGNMFRKPIKLSPGDHWVLTKFYHKP